MFNLVAVSKSEEGLVTDWSEVNQSVTEISNLSRVKMIIHVFSMELAHFIESIHPIHVENQLTLQLLPVFC